MGGENYVYLNLHIYEDVVYLKDVRVKFIKMFIRELVNGILILFVINVPFPLFLGNSSKILFCRLLI